jgi:hypothetical protein
MKIILDEYEKLINQYNSTDEIIKKIKIHDELNKKIY